MDILKKLEVMTVRGEDIREALAVYQSYMKPAEVQEMVTELESLNQEIKAIKNKLVKPLTNPVVKRYSNVLKMDIVIVLQ